MVYHTHSHTHNITCSDYKPASSFQDLERVFPVLTLHFNYISKERQIRRYVVLDDYPELCVQVSKWTCWNRSNRHLCRLLIIQVSREEERGGIQSFSSLEL